MQNENLHFQLAVPKRRGGFLAGMANEWRIRHEVGKSVLLLVTFARGVLVAERWISIRADSAGQWRPADVNDWARFLTRVIAGPIG